MGCTPTVGQKWLGRCGQVPSGCHTWAEVSHTPPAADLGRPTFATERLCHHLPLELLAKGPLVSIGKVLSLSRLYRASSDPAKPS